MRRLQSNLNRRDVYVNWLKNNNTIIIAADEFTLLYSYIIPTMNPKISQPDKELGTEPALSQLDQLLLIGPTLKGTHNQVIYSLPFKYTLQVLQRTALGPICQSWPGIIYKFTLAIRGYTWIPIGSTNW